MNAVRTTTWRVAAAAGLAIVSTALSPCVYADGDASRWFDRYGRPTAIAQQAAAAAQLPPFIEGVSFVFPRKQARMKEPGCIVVQFQVRPDGLTDHFLILESRPKGVFDETVLQSLQFWKFEPTAKGKWSILPISFGFGVEAGTHLPKWDRGCLVPSVEIVASELPAPPLDERKPYYPPPLVESRTQGCVSVRFTIGPDGLADDYEIIDAKPNREFVKTVIQALNEWRFQPPSASTPGLVHFGFKMPLKGTDASAATCRWPPDEVATTPEGPTP